MRFCTKCGSPVSGILRYCTRCGAEISLASQRAAGADAAEAGTADVAGTGPDQVTSNQASTGQATAVPDAPGHPGSGPVIPAQVGVADAEPGGAPPSQPDSSWTAPAWAAPAEASPPGTAPAQTAAAGTTPEDAAPSGATPADTAPAEATPADAAPAGAAPADTAPAGATPADTAPPETAPADTAPAGAIPTEPAVDEPVAAPADSTIRLQAVPASSVTEDGELLRLVRIGGEGDPAPYPEDPWLPGSRRPDRRVLVIGVVVIAGLLAVASTAWLVGTNQPQAGGAHGTHASRPSQLGSGHAQPSQALSGHPAPSLSPASPPATIPTGTGPVKPSPTGHNPSGAAPGTSRTRTGHRGTGHSGTGHRSTGHSSTRRTGVPHPRSGQAGSPRTGSSQPGSHGTGHGQSGPGQTSPGHPPGHAQPGHAGTVRGTAPPAPRPHPSAPAPRSGGRTRHPRHGRVSVAPGLAGRADVRRVAALLDRYFAAVNHRAYQAYARLFTRPGRLTPRKFAWGYSTTHDSNAVLAGLAALKGGLKATVTFTSHQDPAHSPDHSSCIDWTIALFLTGPARPT